jgi:acetyl-CoA carboxylase biotin carboxyl carrier protein
MAKFDVNEDMIRKLAALLDETGLTEIEYKSGDQVIRVARGMGGQMTAVPMTPAPEVQAASAVETGPNPGAVTSPMVGIVYLSPEPGTPPFVNVGDTVTEGQTLLLIEAMKTFNPVRAHRSGKVTEIRVTEKTPVEFGEELIVIA